VYVCVRQVVPIVSVTKGHVIEKNGASVPVCYFDPAKIVATILGSHDKNGCTNRQHSRVNDRMCPSVRTCVLCHPRISPPLTLMTKSEQVTRMLRGLQRDNDPTVALQSSAIEEKRANRHKYDQSRRAEHVLAANEGMKEAMKDVPTDPDLTLQEVANICNNALSFQGTQVQIRDIDNMLVKIDHLTVMFHVALYQEDHKIGKHSSMKRTTDQYCWVEMFGASTGKILMRTDGTNYAQVLQCDGSFIRDHDVWDATVDGNHKSIYVGNNSDNCR
jgi:hypothetical protein